MSVTILEVLQNANHNLNSNQDFQIQMGKEQLKNALTLLEKGYSLYEEFDPLLEEYGDIEKVPDKET